MRVLCIVALLLALAAAAGAEVTVVSTSPANGATNVNPNGAVLRIQFSGPIAPGGYSLPSNQYGERVEFVGKPELSQNNTVFTWAMNLKPGVKYSTSVNDARFQNFRDTEGNPVRTYPLIFTTGSGGGSVAPVKKKSGPSEVHVVRTYPETGAKNVDPKLTYIRIRFSSPVRTDSYSFVNSDQGEPLKFTGKPEFEQGGLLCIAPVRLKQGTTYAVGINSAQHGNFRSASDPDVTVTPYLIMFTTAGKKVSADPKVRIRAWQEDLDFLAEELPANHINLFFKITKDEWRASAAALRKRIPKLTDAQICVELIKLVAKVGDEHTGINAMVQGDMRFLPLKLYDYSDGIYVTAVPESQKEALKCRVDRIGGMPIDQAFKVMGELLPDVNDALRKKAVPNLLTVPQYLEGAGIVPKADKVLFGLKTPDGEPLNVEVQATRKGTGTPLAIARAVEKEPLYLSDLNTPYWAKTIDDGKAVYFQYNRCNDAPDVPMSQMQSELQKMLADENVAKLIIDLRHNGGGSSSLLNPFINWLAKSEKYSKDGRVVVLIGRQTFSSAILNALDLRDKANAVLIGEPTSGSPNHYGEVESFTLPNSGFGVGYSTKYFNNSTDKTPSLVPDVTVELSSKEYFAGKDPVLDAALAN